MSDYGSPFFGEDWPLDPPAWMDDWEGDIDGEGFPIMPDLGLTANPKGLPVIGEQPPKPPVINDRRHTAAPPVDGEPTPEVIGKRRYENVYSTLHAKWNVPADIASTHNNVFALSNLIEAELAAVLTRHLGAVNGFELVLQMDLR